VSESKGEMTDEQFEEVLDSHIKKWFKNRWAIRVFFAWYDFWVGFYYDRDRKELFICPFPMFVIHIHRQIYVWSEQKQKFMKV
jgi:hypothetical protein